MRIILHVDMDAFFAAVEERENPQWKGKPIVVGAEPMAGKGRGVVSTASYKAREYGIRSALPISRAWALSELARKQGKEPAIFVPGNYDLYAEVSERIHQIFSHYSPIIESGGLDEAYIDLTSAGTYGRAEAIAKNIKNEIKKQEKLTCSVGIGPNKLIAKIASDRHKPDGLTVVMEKEIQVFLDPLPARAIPGVGPKTEEVLVQQGIKKISDLRKFPREVLEQLFGKWGRDLYAKARGIDDSPLVLEREVKSIGEQETFLADIRDSLFIFQRLKKLCAGVFSRMEEEGFKTFRTVAVTVRFSDFQTKTKAHTLKEPSQSFEAFEFEAMKLLMPFLDKRENPKNKAVRLIGVRLEKLQ